VIQKPTYQPVQGKTYTLFGENSSTEEYYELIGSLADRVLAGKEIVAVLDEIRKYSSDKRLLRKITHSEEQTSFISSCLHTIHQPLMPFTRKTDEHLKSLSLTKRWGRTLATTEEQYHLYMLEIELTNRLNRDRFLACGRKISLQPHCLQDFAVTCKATKSDFDVVCKGCSKNCYQGKASRIIKDQGIESYIWMGSGIKKAAKEAYKNGQTLGILGIACIPELVAGMRNCLKYRIPVVGIPLNANRCRRWFGEFHPNSIDLEVLEKMVVSR
jgi:hypothetical protein